MIMNMSSYIRYILEDLFKSIHFFWAPSPFLMLIFEPLKNRFPSVISQPNTQANGTSRVVLKLFNNWQHRHKSVKMEP